MADPSLARSRWFRPRLSVRILMILVLVLGGGIGWVAQRARRQRDAGDAIRKAGGVWYDWQLASGKLVPNASPPGPKWLRDAVGPDFLDTVVFVGLRGKDANDDVMSRVGTLQSLERFSLQGKTSPALTPAGMAQIGRLPRLERIVVQGMEDSRGFLPSLWNKPRLRSVWLQSAVVTDDDLARLAHLTTLEELLVNGRDITDAGFAHLANLKVLRHLKLWNCHVGDLSALRGSTGLERIQFSDRPRSYRRVPPVDLSPLRGLSKLDMLALTSMPVDDAGLAQIKDLPQLLILSVSGEGITDAGLAHIAGMPRIVSLDLFRTSIRELGPLTPLMPRMRDLIIPDSPIGDDGIRPLVGATALVRLVLRGTRITDAGLTHLSGLTGLATLDLSETQVGDAGLARLAGLKSLQNLYLRRTPVSDAGIATLRKALPRLKILR